MTIDTFYLSAGLAVIKNDDQLPASGVDTFYITAGLLPQVLVSEPIPPKFFSFRTPYGSLSLRS